ncbi:hypothetical protein A3Q56_00927 [Intoshia linei]|uniref:Epg5-like central TPR repeats domain-containing protein n=1 Tax=Intoshia linei TaxID=1819745 RepID=A0A177BAI7_9BILA|nr:hypothetical protein A3Q56_00927 [Intoshia linei]
MDVLMDNYVFLRSIDYNIHKLCVVRDIYQHIKKLHILKILKHVDIIVQSENVSYRYYFKNCTNDLIRLIIPRVLSSKDPDGKIREKFKHTIMTYIGEIEINDLQCEKLDNVYLVEQMHNIDEIFLIIESIISWQMWFESKNNVNILNALFKKCSDNSNYQKKLLDFLIKIYEDILDKYYKIESGEKNIDEDENKTFKDIWISSKWPVQSTIYNNQFKNAYYISFYFIYCLQMYEEKNELWKKIKYVDYDVSDSNFLESVQNFKNECRIPSKTSTSILLWVEFIKRLSVDSIITMNAWNRTNFDPQIIRKYLKLKKGKSVFNDLNLMAEELNIYYTNLVKKHKLDLFDKYNKEISFQKDNKSLENSITLYNRKISYSQSFCYWLQEERFLDSNMYTLPLPSQYNGDLLTEFVEGDRVSCRAECKKYLGSCSGEAVLKKRINSVISNEVLKKNMNENMSTRIHLISTIIKNMNIRPVAIIEQFEQITKFYIELKNQFLKDKNEKKLTEICNICGNIFHFLIEIFNECATYDYRINSHIKKSMDMIGNEFIKTDVKNNYILFQYIVNNNCKNSIVCNAFQPITNFNNFVKFYETTINKIEENKFDFTLNLLPKFDIKKWYSLLKGDEEDIKNIYKIIIQSYFKINEMNNSQVDALLTIIKDHFKIIITHTFKTHYHVVLFELLELSKNKINNAQIWSDLYDITKENGEEILKNILIQDVHEIMKLVSNYLMKHRLSLIEKLEIDTKNYTKYNLKSQENQVEMVKQLKNGHIVSLPEKSTLYSFWSKYTTPFSQLFHLISIKSIEMSFSDPTFSILKDDERVSLLWESIITFYEPWIKPIKSTDLNNQYLPWNQNDEINVYEMIEMFFSVIVKLMDTYLDFDINVNNLPLNLALNYYEKNIENSNCLFMNCVYRDQFVKINWKHFQPCESTIMLMTKYCNTNDNKPIIMKILADVDWISISNKILKTEDDNFIRIYHRNLLGVFCHALVDNPIKKNDFYDYINVITNLKSKYIDADSLVAAVTVVMNNLSIDIVLHSLTCNIKYDCSEDDKEQVKSHHMIYVVMITSVVQQLLPKISNHANLTIKLYSMLLEDVTIILSSIPTTNSMKNMDIIYKPIISLLNCVEYNNIQLFINTTIEWMFVLSTNQKTDEKMSNFIERFIALIMLRMYRSDILYSLCNAMMDNFSKETNSFEVIIEHIKESNVNHVHDIIQTALYSCRPILSKRKTLSKIINDTLTKSLLPAKCPITAIVFAVLIKYLRNVYLSDKNKLIEIFKLYSKIIIEFCTDMNQTRYVIILLNDMFSFIDKLVYPDSPLLQELGREIKDFVEIIDVKLLKRHLHSIMPIPLNNATPYVQYMAFVAVFLSANLYSKNNNVRYDSSIHLSQWDLPYSSDFVKFTEKTFKVLLSKKNEQYSTKISQLAIRYIYESSFNLLNIADIMRDLNHLYFS